MKRISSLKQIVIISVIIGALVIGSAIAVTNLGNRLYFTTASAEMELAEAELCSISSDLAQVRNALRQTILNSDVLRGIGQAGSLEFVSSLEQITTSFQLVRLSIGTNYNFALFDYSNGAYYELFGVDVAADIHSAVRESLCNDLKGLVRNGYWYRQDMGGTQVEYCIYVYNGYALVGWIFEDNMLAAFEDIPLGREGYVQVRSKNEGLKEGTVISRSNVSNVYDLTPDCGEFLGEVEIVGNSSIMHIVVMQYVVLGLMGALVALLVFQVWYLNRRVLKPTVDVLDSLTAYKNENTAEDLEEMVSNVQLTEANTVLDNMLQTMKGLKVKLYEKELSEKKLQLDQNKLQLDYMQLQLQPHFLINCLNIVYSMYAAGATDTAQRMIRYMADYYRYSSRECFNEVSLDRELQRVDNYLKIQQTWKNEEIEYMIEAEEPGQYMVPPMCIMTFVENAIKYGLRRDRKLIIRIGAEMIRSSECDDHLRVIISNSGDGFPVDMLEELERDGGLTSVDGHRTGITNIIRRVQMMYGDRASVRLYNDENGANVELLIPVGRISKAG